MPRRVEQKYLMKTGRRPLNRVGYPTMGTPISADMSLEPGSFGSVNDPILLSVQTRAGRRFTTRVYDPASSVSLGQSHRLSGPLDDLVTGFTAQFNPMLTAPAVPSVIAAPTPASSSSIWSPLTSLVNLWNERPQVLKDISFKVNPTQVMQAAQSVVQPAQVSGFVRFLQSIGIQPTYQNVPVSGPMASAGYQYAGMNLAQYLPYIIAGGAALFLLPKLMGGRK
jgi:hypothetical protein